MSSSRDHMLKVPRLRDHLLQNVQQNCCKMSRDSWKASKFQITCTPDHKCCKMSCDHNHLPHLLQNVQNSYILMISTLVLFFLTHWYVSLLFAYLLSLGPFLNNNYNETYLCYWPPKFNSVLKFCCITTYYCDFSRHKYCIISYMDLLFTALCRIYSACLPLHFKFWPNICRIFLIFQDMRYRIIGIKLPH